MRFSVADQAGKEKGPDKFWGYFGKTRKGDEIRTGR